MKNVIDNISNQKIVVLTDVRFSANDYKNYPDNVVLNGMDNVEIKAINKESVEYSITRTIRSEKEEDFVSFYVSFDIEIFFKEPYDEDKVILESDMIKAIKENTDVFDCGCSARISLIIAQISAQLAEGTPIISPASLMIGE